MMKSSLFQHHQQEENMSNLSSASNEAASVSSATNFHFAPPNQSQSQPLKRKRNLPGNPDPESEVIALSPKTLMATNRFICEICNKGFQRDQNLQLHRRGHNLPWKLKQRSSKEVVRKKVYVCPETSCVHHDPSRALGDLTGIKKHFSRKHGEKKWKCEKCSKRYAVQSDWKAHSKVCGTREYRCDCGTLFSRRDSFITHRAFCDALAQESSRAITCPPNPLQIPQFNNTQDNNFPTFSLKKEQESFNLDRPDLPPWLAPNPNPNPSQGPTLPHYQTLPIPPHMSATGLLQKAAQMGSTQTALVRPHQGHVPPGSLHNTASFHSGIQVTYGDKDVDANNSGALLQEMMSSGFDQDAAFVDGVFGNSRKDGGFPAASGNHGRRRGGFDEGLFGVEGFFA